MLEVKNLTYEVLDETNGKKVKKRILDGVSLKVEKGETVVITGPNGSGKSTLSKIIMGILTPTSGKVLWNGKDITKLKVEERAKLGISFAFQQPVKIKGLTVKDLLELSCGRELTITEACEHLSGVGLCARDYVNREIDDSLSGGELKRIEIASVTIRNSLLTIFDEPEAGIDLWSFNSLISAFLKMQQKSKGANIIVSHQERLISVATKAVLLKEGKVEKIGSPQEILKGITPQKIACNVLEVKNAN